jgi:hypothetical protein
MKANELIRDSLQELGQLAAEQPITADQYATGIRYANRLGRNHAYLGLGYTILVNSSDTVTIPCYAEEWFVKALAVRMASQYGAFDGLDMLKMDERTAYNAMLRSIDFDYSQSMPAGLPVGIFVEQQYDVEPFYVVDDDLILSESGGYIEVESGS